MEMYVERVTEVVMTYVPNMLAALAVLAIGIVVALIARWVVQSALRRTEVDNRLAAWITGREGEEAPETERYVGKAVFYLIMLFVLVAFFETLGLAVVTEPINRFLSEIFAYAPRLLAPAVLLLVAWAVASGLRFAVRRILDSTQLDERLAAKAELEEATSLSQTLAETVYWLVFLLFLPAILGALGLDGLLGPVQHMLDSLLSFLPKLLGAGLIFAVGWLVARIVQRIVSGLLAAVGADRLSERAGLNRVLGKQQLSGVVGLVVYTLILVPVIIAALNALELEAITQPASNMLATIMNAIPAIFGAVLVLAIAYLLGKILSGLAANLLAGLGFDRFVKKLGLRLSKENTASLVAGHLIMVAIMLFAAIEAAEMMGFAVFADLAADFTVFAGQVVMALIVFGAGLFLANLVFRTLSKSRTSQAQFLATAARIAILVLTGSMALRQLGIAGDIINLAFGLILGAVAVAAAIAFGIGGRDLAARQLESWSSSAGGKQAGSRDDNASM